MKDQILKIFKANGPLDIRVVAQQIGNPGLFIPGSPSKVQFDAIIKEFQDEKIIKWYNTGAMQDTRNGEAWYVYIEPETKVLTKK
jgi:hypothetical protein